MAEKDATVRLRRAVKENNLFLVRRLIQRTDMRNPDPGPRRLTSLAWAAALGHEETFEFLLTAGHDDEELSKDSENNTILMILADQKPEPSSTYVSQSSPSDASGACLRMARLYYDRYSWILDWSNIHGKTALHIASLKGNEELVRMLCDLGADYDLSDNKGNTPLHYASSWGHIPVVQLLIERGCQYAARNNEGFTASDYAYSFGTRDTLQDTARLQYENNKKARRQVFAQAAERGSEWGASAPINVPLLGSSKVRDLTPRMRSGSGTSRTTSTSESGDIDSNSLAAGHQSQPSFSVSSSPSHLSTGSTSLLQNHPVQGRMTSHMASMSSTTTLSGPSAMIHGSSSTPTTESVSAITNRMRERDADAIEKYMRRTRSGSQGTSSTENRSQNGSIYSSARPVTNGDDVTPLNPSLVSGSTTPRRLRPSVSAAQLGARQKSNDIQLSTHPESRNRAGTNPLALSRPSQSHSPYPPFARTSSISASPKSGSEAERSVLYEAESYVGPPSQYAQFPEPPPPTEDSTTSLFSRRKHFHLLSKPPSNLELAGSSHRRGVSGTSARGVQ